MNDGVFVSMDLSRISNPTEVDTKRNKKYAKALAELITE
jgi:hypothetical protein